MALRRFGIFAVLTLLVLSARGQGTFNSHFEGGLRLLPSAPAQLLPDSPPQSKKSVGLAILYSLAVPGLGEAYAGGFSSGRYFLGAEGLLWLTYIAFDVHGTSLRSDARSFAAVHAGVNPAGKGDQFYVDVGNFLSVADYNGKKMRDRNPELVYDPSAGYNWTWDSEADRAAFKDQRLTSEHVFDNRKFVIAAVLVNHVASAINAARLAISHNKEVQGGLGELRFEASVMGGWLHPYGVLLTVTRQI